MAITLTQLWLTDFRNYRVVDVELAPGTTAIVGQNGQGKTNLLEAVAFLAGTSLRGAAADTLVRTGSERAVVRGRGRRGARDLLVEAELVVRGRNRFQLNRQPVRRQRDLLEALAVTVFSPDDLVLVKGGPGERRRWLDDALVGLDTRRDAVRAELDRILRQRNALLKQCRGRLDDAAGLTLDVWDERLARTGTELAALRTKVLDDLRPEIETAYRDLAGRALTIGVHYDSAWSSDGLAEALAVARRDDVRRGVTTVGPHRDEVTFTIDGLPARTHASQGEQRSLALAMRLAVHRAIRDVTGDSPILLLDDVFSELDDSRSDALLAHLPPGQTLLTTATSLPAGTAPERLLRVSAGGITAAG